MIKNPNHVKGVRDGVHAGLQAFAKSAGLGDRDIDGSDAVTGIAMALRDIIQSAPDGYVRAKLASQAIHALEDAARGSVIVPARHMPTVN